MSDVDGNLDKLPDYLNEFEDDVPEDMEGDGPSVQKFANIPIETLLDLPSDHSVVGGLYMTHTASRLYGTANTIKIIKKVGQDWIARHPGSAIGIGDISKRGGGPLSGHKSHRRGIDFDVRPMRTDGQRKPVTVHDDGYSRFLTGELIDMFVSNGILKCTHVFFNDRALQKPPVQEYPNHANHFHVRFALG